MIEVLKQLAEDVSKAYDVLAFAHTERALEILAKTRTSLRQAIAELESQEPVAWMDADGNISDNNDHKCFFPIPLYTTQGEDYRAMYLKVRDELAELQQRTWIKLTDEEVFEICNSNYTRDSELVKMVEAKLKERNDHSI